MGATDMTQREALLRLGASTAEAIAQVLEMFAPGAVERGDVSVIGEDASPFAGVTPGSVAASVSYVNGVTGANIFALTPAGVRKLSQAMGMPAPQEGEDTELSELELSAIGEASNQMMAAAASAIGVVLGQEIEISVPDIRTLESLEAAAEGYGSTPHATSTTFLIAGESCRLIQLIPSAFVVRMAAALDELGEDADGPDGVGTIETDGSGKGESVALVEALGGIQLRVWAELGRGELALGRALGLPLGSVVELNQAADAPIDLYVNGLRFAQGHLIVTDDGEWAFHCDAVGGRTAESAIPTPDAAPEAASTPDEAPEAASTPDAAPAPGPAPQPDPEGALN